MKKMIMGIMVMIISVTVAGLILILSRGYLCHDYDDNDFFFKDDNVECGDDYESHCCRTDPLSWVDTFLFDHRHNCDDE